MEHGCSKNTPARRQPHGRSGPADRRHLQGFGFRQRRQQPRKTLGQYRFADRAGRSSSGDGHRPRRPQLRTGPTTSVRSAMGSGAGDGVSIRSTTGAIAPMFGRPTPRRPRPGWPRRGSRRVLQRPAFALGGQHRRQHPLEPDGPARRAPIRPAARSFRVAPTPSCRWLTRPRKRAPDQRARLHSSRPRNRLNGGAALLRKNV